VLGSAPGHGPEAAERVVRALADLLAAPASISYIRGMNLELNDVQTAVLTRELHSIIQNDRYPLSPRIVALKEILGQLRPEPEREPFPCRRRRSMCHREPPPPEGAVAGRQYDPRANG
jgi:hypothetical protein